MSKILIAGGSGFIGRALIQKILDETDHEIVALSRFDRVSGHKRLTWKRCDLFSLKDVMAAMEGTDTAYYLVHSMLPSADLSQGTFYDFDLILADNFKRAAEFHKLKHIVYLGGMIPKIPELSWHLKSRLEVEDTLRASKIPVTALRAGLIIGPEGSSFTILEKLIERLPMLICPAWSQTLSQPIALQDVLNVLMRTQNTPDIQGKIFDIAGKEVITYQELIRRTALLLGLKRVVYRSNLIPVGLSRLWVSLITGAPRNLVYPLILSLKYPMLVNPDYLWPFPVDLKTSLNTALKVSFQKKNVTKFKGYLPKHKEVRSIQRLTLPKGKSAEWMAQVYFEWLPKLFSSLIKIQIQDNRCVFYLLTPSIKFLVLERSAERSSPDRQLLYITGGLLVKPNNRGRLEFREVLNRKYVLTAIHQFTPALPWFVYRYTQALIHLYVTNAFEQYLRRVES